MHSKFQNLSQIVSKSNAAKKKATPQVSKQKDKEVSHFVNTCLTGVVEINAWLKNIANYVNYYSQ